MIRRRVFRIMLRGGVPLVVLVVAFATWFWNWNPPAPSAKLFTLKKMGLAEAVHDTTMVHTYPNLSNTSLRLSRPSQPPRLSADQIITEVYHRLGEQWYPGPVEMYYAHVDGSPVGNHNVWIVEDHMLFSHSYPMIQLSVWEWSSWVYKFHQLRQSIKPKTASSYAFIDATTGKSMGAYSTESF